MNPLSVIPISHHQPMPVDDLGKIRLGNVSFFWSSWLNYIPKSMEIREQQKRRYTKLPAWKQTQGLKRVADCETALAPIVDVTAV